MNAMSNKIKFQMSTELDCIGVPKRGGGAQPPPKTKKKNRFCRHDDIKDFM
jgi:hypothetical protein